uniref:NADH:ubiquinone reductase (H(+)-translocating) n=1 Tax=Liriope tetraphylla TaxID=37524 RepID=A0A0S2IBJ0_9CNID|nr:NADH dehydrogenase subunit 2 [Liriope tetraphylla]
MSDFNYEILFSILMLSLLVLGTSMAKSLVLTGILFIGLFYFIIGDFSDWHMNMWSFNNWKYFIKVLLLIITLKIWFLLDRKDINNSVLLLFVLVGSILLISCEHLLLIYLALELQTFSLFVLIAKNRNSMLSTEAGLKYFILGAISSGIFLLGVSIIYGISLSMSLKDIAFINQDNFILIVAQSLILIALLFKLTAVPFHMWAPDVYEGASTEIVALIATVPKVSVLIVLMNLNFPSDLLLLAAVFSMVFGTLGALNQNKIKRLIAYSGISHMGFILLGIALFNIYGQEASFVYLLIYLFMIIATFSIILISPMKNYLIIELSGVIKNNKTVGLTWAILLLSIGGIPPLAGFISKWLLLWTSLNNAFYVGSLIGILCSMVAGAYYLRIVKIVYFQKTSNFIVWENLLNKDIVINESLALILGISIYMVLFLIINPNPWVLFSHWGVVSLF